MDKKIYFITDNKAVKYLPIDVNIEYYFEQTDLLITNLVDNIATTQLSCLSPRLWGLGYRVFICDKDGCFEIKIGDNDFIKYFREYMGEE